MGHDCHLVEKGGLSSKVCLGERNLRSPLYTYVEVRESFSQAGERLENQPPRKHCEKILIVFHHLYRVLEAGQLA